MFYDELAAFVNEAATIEDITADVMLDMKHKLFNVAFSRGVVAKRPQSKVPLESQVGDSRPE